MKTLIFIMLLLLFGCITTPASRYDNRGAIDAPARTAHAPAKTPVAPDKY